MSTATATFDAGPAIWPRRPVDPGGTSLTSQSGSRPASVLELIFGPYRGGAKAAHLLEVDAGTRAGERTDVRALMNGTWVERLSVDGSVEPVVGFSRMARIRSLAGLSLREWADVFDVTHTTIKHWTASEPDRPKLERVLAALEQASRYRSDLSGWLMASVPGTELRPIDLLREERWRAFDGAVHSQPAEAMTISAEELRRLRRLDESWLLAEPPIEHE